MSDDLPGRIGSDLFLTTLIHPLKQMRILIQLGYEPVKPAYKSGLFSSSGQYVQPGILTPLVSFGERKSYLTCAGLFQKQNITKGLTMSLCNVVVNTVIMDHVTKPVESAFPETEECSFDQVILDSIRQLLINSSGLILANPFRVIAVRQIASIADGSSTSLVDLFRQGGLFSGLVPQLTFEVLSILTVNLTVYIYKKHQSEKDSKIVKILTRHLVHMVLYPLKLVSTIQCVKTGPLNDFAELDWLSILRHLIRQNVASRGSSIIGDRVITFDQDFKEDDK